MSERAADGTPASAIMLIKSVDTLVKRREKKRDRYLGEALADMSASLLIADGSEGKLLYASPGVCQLCSCRDQAALRKCTDGTLLGLIHEEDRARFAQDVREQLKGSDGALEGLRCRVAGGAGEPRWVEGLGRLTTSPDGTRRLCLFFTDITASLSSQQKSRLALRARCR